MATPQDRLEQLIRLQGQALGVLRTMQEGIANIAAKVKELKGGGGGGGKKKKEKGASVFKQIAGVLGTVSKVFAVVSAVVAGVTAALLVVPLAIAGVVHASEKYVAALNPALVERYNDELRNLNATIGFGLTPIIAYATKSVKEWAGILLPGITKLRPIVEGLSQAISGATSGAIRFLGNALEATAARWAQLLPYWQNMIDTLGGFFEVMAAVVDVLGMFELGFKANLDFVKLTSENLRAAFIGLAAMIVRIVGLFGGLEAVLGFRKSLTSAIEARKNPKPGLIAAPQDSSVSGIEDIAKRMAERAFAATAGAGDTKKSETDLLELILHATEAINPRTLTQVITDAVVEGFMKAREGIADSVPGRVVDRLTNPDTSAVGLAGALLNPGAAFGGALGLVFGGG